MKPQQRHYTEEELLFHSLGDEDSELSAKIAEHVERCSECAAVLYEYSEMRRQVALWKVEEPSEQSWLDREASLMGMFRADRETLGGHGFLKRMQQAFSSVWEYALNNPLATMGYIAAVVAFASERTITLFSLEHLLPKTNEVLEILRQVL